jgi:hypothetical protein
MLGLAFGTVQFQGSRTEESASGEGGGLSEETAAVGVEGVIHGRE